MHDGSNPASGVSRRCEGRGRVCLLPRGCLTTTSAQLLGTLLIHFRRPCKKVKGKKINRNDSKIDVGRCVCKFDMVFCSDIFYFRVFVESFLARAERVLQTYFRLQFEKSPVCGTEALLSSCHDAARGRGLSNIASRHIALCCNASPPDAD